MRPRRMMALTSVIGLPVAPYPLGGEARDVLEDVRRLGGFGIVAHPDSPKEALRWGYLMNMGVDSFRSTFDKFARA